MNLKSTAYIGILLLMMSTAPSYSEGSNVSDAKKITEIVEIPMNFGNNLILNELCQPGMTPSDPECHYRKNGASTIVTQSGQYISVTKREMDLAVLKNKAFAIDTAKWQSANEAIFTNLGEKDPTLHHVELIEESPILLSISCGHSYALQEHWKLSAVRDTQKFRCIDNAIFNLMAKE